MEQMRFHSVQAAYPLHPLPNLLPAEPHSMKCLWQSSNQPPFFSASASLGCDLLSWRLDCEPGRSGVLLEASGNEFEAPSSELEALSSELGSSSLELGSSSFKLESLSSTLE